ncbi:hypothetical protein M3Y99_01231200 [Aphelenchoides fujianensis]|nr:hypothetical protein M3Y99_01231200 [Aphelenchoides fujianensis]
MSTAQPTATIKKPLGKSVRPAESLHVLPARLEYTGPAEVRRFFSNADNEWGSFRGQAIKRARIQTPDGFAIFVAAKSGRKSDTTKRFVLESKTDHLMSWERDRPSNFTAQLRKAVDFLAVAQAAAED